MASKRAYIKTISKILKWSFAILFFILLVSYFLLRSWGMDKSQYPNPASSAYVLPIKSGSKTFCIQSHNTLATHKGKFKYSYDFLLPLGTEIYAAREGMVSDLLDTVQDIGWYKGNFIAIIDGDGNKAIYAHLQYKGVSVKVGDSIRQKQLIGYSGSTGKSVYPHLHFHVEKDGQAVPVSFRDIKENRGVPRFMRLYQAD